jgi:hypothetical protein
MSDLTRALGLDNTTNEPATCRHEWATSAQECARCGISWADAMRGFGSNVQQLSGRVKRVVRA